MKTRAYQLSDPYELTLVLDTDLVQHLASMDWAAVDLTTGTGELDYAARQLHHYTGVQAALVGDGGAVLALHLWGSTSYRILADDMGGQPTMTVLRLDGIAQPEWRLVFQVTFDRWQDLAQAAAAIDLR